MTTSPALDAELQTHSLHYIDDSKPGLSRQRFGKGFAYFDTRGKRIKNPKIVKRLQKLAMPPAYSDVWFCPNPRGHIQAVGWDARGRKQYRYHESWTQLRDSHKYERMIDFAKSMPTLRKVTDRHLRLKGLPREKVLAAMVKLLEKTLIRVGNDEYARKNKSYGLTTLRDSHVTVKGTHMIFKFRGKSGVKHELDLEDARLATIVRRCQELPGYEVFEYIDATGKRHDVKSEHINAYLREVTGHAFTAKDFRTWAGTLLAAKALQEYRSFSSQTEAKKQVLKAIESVSKKLGNTKAICRKCYVHPAVIESHMDGSLAEIFEKKATDMVSQKFSSLKKDEAAILVLLEKRLKKDGASQKTSRR
ncbi:MAG: DNA topoisomerase IB [Bdellovibrionota bacterium]